VDSPRFTDATRAESLIDPVTRVSLSRSPNFKFEREKLLKQAEILWPMAGVAANISKRFATTIHNYLHEHAKTFLSSALTNEIWGESLMVEAEDKTADYKGGLGEDGGSEESRRMEDSFLRLGAGGKQKDGEFIKLRPAEVKIEKTVGLARENGTH